MTESCLHPSGARVGSQIGRSVPRLEGRDKVIGGAQFTHTCACPAVLYTKLFRSTVAHGKIKSLDTSAAKKHRGVLHVVTVKRFIPNAPYGPGVP